jgi:hypothetical protein
LPIPANPWSGKTPRYASLQEACEAGVTAEIANGEQYECLFAATNRSDILIVFRNPQEASQQRHLPTFRRCAQGGGGGGLGGQRHWGGRGWHEHRIGKGRRHLPGHQKTMLVCLNIDFLSLNKQTGATKLSPFVC